MKNKTTNILNQTISHFSDFGFTRNRNIHVGYPWTWISFFKNWLFFLKVLFRKLQHSMWVVKNNSFVLFFSCAKDTGILERVNLTFDNLCFLCRQISAKYLMTWKKKVNLIKISPHATQRSEFKNVIRHSSNRCVRRQRMKKRFVNDGVDSKYGLMTDIKCG